MIHGEAVQPRSEARLSAKPAELPVGVQESLLQQVFRVLRGSSHPERQAIQAGGVRAIELFEGSRLPLHAPLRQLEVGGSHVP